MDEIQDCHPAGLLPGAFHRPRLARLSTADPVRQGAEGPRRKTAYPDPPAAAGKGDHLRPERRKDGRHHHGRFRLRRSVQDRQSRRGGRAPRRHSPDGQDGSPEETVRHEEFLLARPENRPRTGQSRAGVGHRRDLHRQGAQALLSQRRTGRPSDRLRRHGRHRSGRARTAL